MSKAPTRMNAIQQYSLQLCQSKMQYYHVLSGIIISTKNTENFCTSLVQVCRLIGYVNWDFRWKCTYCSVGMRNLFMTCSAFSNSLIYISPYTCTMQFQNQIADIENSGASSVMFCADCTTTQQLFIDMPSRIIIVHSVHILRSDMSLLIDCVLHCE